MSNVLSNNHNGKVLKTSNGFSPATAVKFITKFANANGIDIEVNKAKSGTYYVSLWGEKENLDIRLSNHTKRNWDLSETEGMNERISNFLKGLGPEPFDTFQVINKEMYNELKELLKLI